MGIVSFLKEELSTEKKLRKKLGQTLENTNKALVELQSTNQSTKALTTDLEGVIKKLENIQSDAVKIGNFEVFAETEKFKQVVANLYAVTKKMETDVDWMHKFVLLVRKFNEMFVTYKEMTSQFKNASKSFQGVSLLFGEDNELQKVSKEIAKEMQTMSTKFSNFKISYVPISTNIGSDLDFSDLKKEFEERRKALVQQMPQ